jgi:hypothetical protein
MTTVRTLSLPRLGTLWPEQGGIFLGVMPATADDQPEYGLILCVDPAGDFKDTPWGEYGKRLDGCDSDNDGLANTLAMAEAGNNLAWRITALQAGGFSDWYLPARNELRLAYISAPKAFSTDDWYWSSTQYSAYGAWGQLFDDGSQYYGDKDSQARARAVRRFLIT